MLIGYARVSTDEQVTALQIDALTAAGCDQIYEEKASGATAERTELKSVLKAVRKGDTLVVLRLDRLGRSIRDLIEIVENLKSHGVGFRSIMDSVDTTTAAGKLFFHMIGALAEFERNLISERTRAGLTAARARGRLGGRPRKLPPKQVKIARKMLEDREYTVTGVAEHLGVSRSTLYRALA